MNHRLQKRIVELAKCSLRISREGLCGEPPDFTAPAFCRFLAPSAVLALEGSAEDLERFLATLRNAAAQRLGIDRHIVNNRLSDSFCMRSVVEAYHGLIDAGLISIDVQRELAPWLYEMALVTVDGRVRELPDFQQWHLRNQNVPAAMVYVVAHLLDKTCPGQFDTAPLWEWGDAQIVGWDLTCRGPDDSWLYQFIWTWSAYTHARLRRPDLLECDNARRCFEFYKTLSLPGMGVDMVLGESKPGDLLGAAVSLLLGARLFSAGEQLFLAERIITEVERRGLVENLADRGPEFYRLYSLCPENLVPVPLRSRKPCLMTTPLAGRGWQLAEPYGDDVRTTDRRYPFFGEELSAWDPLYQVQEAAAYAEDKPDKIVLADSDDSRSLFAVVDLRAHGLHDHADALGISLLTCDGQPWLVESSYFPRETAAQRWYHNVPLLVPGEHDISELRTWRADTWRSVETGDVHFQDCGTYTVAVARLRHDGFDYVDFDHGLVDYERVLLFVPDEMLLVIDRLVPVREATATVGQIWHTPAEVTLDGDLAVLRRDDRAFHITFAHSHPMQTELTQHEAAQNDPYYFRPDNPVRDLLWGAALPLEPGRPVCMAAALAREPTELEARQDGGSTRVVCDGLTLVVCFGKDGGLPETRVMT